MLKIENTASHHITSSQLQTKHQKEKYRMYARSPRWGSLAKSRSAHAYTRTHNGRVFLAARAASGYGKRTRPFHAYRHYVRPRSTENRWLCSTISYYTYTYSSNRSRFLFNESGLISVLVLVLLWWRGFCLVWRFWGAELFGILEDSILMTFIVWLRFGRFRDV